MKNNFIPKLERWTALALLALVPALPAQEAKLKHPSQKEAQAERLKGEAHFIMREAPGLAPADQAGTYAFISSEMSIDGKVVKGRPYSAEAVTETTQWLADGNRIHRRSVSAVFRDSEGRTRREENVGGVGPWAGGGESEKTIFINDPVARENFILSPQSQTARKTGYAIVSHSGGDANSKIVKMAIERAGVETQVVKRKIGEVKAGDQEVTTFTFRSGGFDKSAMRTEELGMQTIEGVSAQGTRTIHTIPAGEIGNDRPIEVVWEKWYSPDLEAVVMSRHSDPRMGETVYKLTRISRTEPRADLFQVPAGYKMDSDIKSRIELKMKPKD